MKMADRFRGFLPIALDIETSGFDAQCCAILEIGAVTFDFADDRIEVRDQVAWAVAPFKGAVLDPASLKVTGINPADPDRGALSESDALDALYRLVRRELKRKDCQRAIVVAHNASFDQQFLKSAVARNAIKRDPFHPFSSIDTASLAAVAYGHTVLAQACARAGIPFETERAHSAAYDASRAALLFRTIVNGWGAPPTAAPGQATEAQPPPHRE
jgi:ribonuclease T